MARKIPIKVTARVTTRVQRQVRVRHQSGTRSSGHIGFAAWQGPMPQHTTNNYGDTNTISGRGHQVTIGVSGSVIQISGPPPVDPERLATAAQQLPGGR